MLKEGLVSIWELHMNLVPTLLDKYEPLGIICSFVPILSHILGQKLPKSRSNLLNLDLQLLEKYSA